ncbi:hypothetical protein HKD37_20G056785 [Glycine soja]
MEIETHPLNEEAYSLSENKTLENAESESSAQPARPTIFREGKYLYLEACHSIWKSLVTQANHHGGVAFARQSDLDTCCLIFLSESVVWIHLGYLLTNGTILHLRDEVRCMHQTEHD